MILHLNEDLSTESFQKLIEGYNSLDHEDILTIYFYSRGGLTRIADCFKDVLERNYNRTLLIGTGFLGSCAFSLFFEVSCPKILLEDTIGIFHQSLMDVTFNENQKPVTPYDKLILSMMKNYHSKTTKRTLDFCEMTQKEQKEILSGKDVYFDQKRMQEIFEKTKEKLKFL